MQIRTKFSLLGLSQTHPVFFRSPNKQYVLNMCKDAVEGYSKDHEIVFSRWSSVNTDFPQQFSGPLSNLEIEAQKGFFPYDSSGDDACDWWPNFAHSHLFVAWNSDLLAQDELQVCEHPVLASIQMELQHNKQLTPHSFTADREVNKATPILIKNVPRVCAIDTSKGLYGNAFAHADPMDVKMSTKILNPPTISNLYCIEAPPGGYGAYSKRDIVDIFKTAYTAFRACKEETILGAPEDAKDSVRTVIRLGYWGCGAYGGNTTLMVALQLLAAHLAGVNKVVFHLAREGPKPFAAGKELCQTLLDKTPNGGVEDMLTQIESMKFKWGTSTGE
eukprot:TRINITY_DN66123_c4_g1_i1.p1 TRINITY_DN66123_c4_g1~~TRINITY_DN66123_c4_g1_i1.p1  ORF type:complete len:365 (+),score=35.59 TRINITY_DN66123_c4_g1_i1:102-1097(+)